jgi:SAM-dependent methyltransferase
MKLQRYADGSAGDANYGMIGNGYTSYRQPDPAIAGFINRTLGAAQTVLNVGAGAGSYEPVDRQVTAVEPSASMRAQRPTHLALAVDALAQSLPFADGSFDASMATFTVHQWPDLGAGLAEMRRVTRGPILILTCDPETLNRFWLMEYAKRTRRQCGDRSRSHSSSLHGWFQRSLLRAPRMPVGPGSEARQLRMEFRSPCRRVAFRRRPEP